MGGKHKPLRPRPGVPPPADDARKNPPHVTHQRVLVSFEYYQAGQTYCLCNCDKEQTKSFLDCLRKLTQRTWQQLIEGSSKNRADKTGLNCTPYQRSDLRNRDIWPTWLSQDITRIYGVRASGKRRIFGARIEAAFYVIWFDDEHGVVDG
jgi:hypothetical protein